MMGTQLLEDGFNRHLHKWLAVPKSFSNIGLYSTSSKLQLPLSSITEEFKVTKTRQVMMLRDSKNDKAKEANVDVRTGRKWVAKTAVEDAESRLRHRDIVGVVTSGLLGFGNIHQPLWQSADTRHRRELVQIQFPVVGKKWVVK